MNQVVQIGGLNHNGNCSLVCISPYKTIWTGIIYHSTAAPGWWRWYPELSPSGNAFTFLGRLCKWFWVFPSRLALTQPIITREAEKSVGPSPVLCEWLCDSFVIMPTQLPYSFLHYWPTQLRLNFVTILYRQNIKLINGEDRQRGSIVCSLPFQSMFKLFFFLRGFGCLGSFHFTYSLGFMSGKSCLSVWLRIQALSLLVRIIYPVSFIC